MDTQTTKPLVIAYSNFFVVRFPGIDREVVIEITQPRGTWSKYQVYLRGEATAFSSRSGEQAMQTAWQLASAKPEALDDNAVSKIASKLTIVTPNREGLINNVQHLSRSIFNRIVKAALKQRLGFKVAVRLQANTYIVEPAFDKNVANWNVEVIRRSALVRLAFDLGSGAGHVMFSLNRLMWAMSCVLGGTSTI